MRSRRQPAVAGALALALLAAACTSGADDPTEEGREGATAAAGLLAEGLSAGSLADVPMPADVDAAAAQDQLAQVTADALEPLGDERPEVTMVENSVALDDGGNGAAATLTWAWPFPDGSWEYDTEVRLVRDGGDASGEPGAWQVDWAPSVIEPSLEGGEDLRTAALPAKRGEVLGRGGARIVRERRVVRVGIDKTQVRPGRAPGSARALARALDIAGPPFVEAVRTAGPQAFVEAIVLRPGDAQVAASLVGQVPGARSIGDRLPLAPSREFAAPILGRVGEATAEIVEESGGQIGPGDQVGLSGLQRRYEEQLGGTPGFRVSAIAPSGNTQALFTVPPEPGEPLRTSLDLRLQRRAERTLAPLEPASALVVLQPSTGAVLAAASGPGSDGFSTATFGQYAPGSTFKIVSTLALLRSGLDPGSTVPCPARTTVDGKEFSNYDGYPRGDLGPIPLRRALASSCNTAFVERRGRAPHARLAAAAAALGLGIDHDVGYPAYFGEVPEPTSQTQAAADLIGQGTVSASPLAMASVMASVVAGEAVLPVLLPDVEPDGGTEGGSRPGEIEEPLAAAEARALRTMLRLVVADGSGNLLADVPGPPVLAKTGTAEYGTPGPDGSLPTHAWMVAAQGDLAVAAFVEDGESGSGTAGPLVEQMLRAR